MAIFMAIHGFNLRTDTPIDRLAGRAKHALIAPLGIDPSHFLQLFPGKVGKAVVGCSCNVVSLGWWTSRSAKYCKVRSTLMSLKIARFLI